MKSFRILTKAVISFFLLCILFWQAEQLFASQSPVYMPTTDIDHYESIFHADEDYAYLAVKTAGVDNQLGEWRNPDFDDSEWPTGSGGIGFGDDDDGTMISRSYSVYMRKWFNIDDLPDIEKLILIADYDDGFVAYINSFEVYIKLLI